MITWLWGAESFRTNWLQSSKNILLKTTTTHGVENVLPMGCCGINWHPTSLPSSQRCVSRQDGGQQMWTGIRPAAALIPKSTGRPFPSSALVSKSKTSKHNFLCGLSAHPDPFFISRDVFIPLKQELMPMLNSWFAAAVFFFFFSGEVLLMMCEERFIYQNLSNTKWKKNAFMSTGWIIFSARTYNKHLFTVHPTILG